MGCKTFFKKKIEIYWFRWSWDQVRDVIHIDDVCEITLKQIKNLKKINNDLFNIGGGSKSMVSLKKLTELCQKITGNKIPIGSNSITSIFDIPIYVSNNKKIKKTYNWYPKRNIENIVKDIYIWLYNNKKIWKYFK